MRELEEHNYNPGQAIEAMSVRVCVICRGEITSTELKKGLGAWIPAGNSLRFSAHSTCLSEVEQAIDEQRQQEQEANDAVQIVRDIARTAQQATRKHR